MNFARFLKKLEFPEGSTLPSRLTYRDVVATAITRADLADDVRGINASLRRIRETRGGKWPTGPVTEDENYVDLVWHECEFRERYSFAYAVYDTAGQYLGCCYFYPMGRRTPLDEQLLRHDVDVSWWVTEDAYRRGYYAKLYVALRRWIADAFPFRDAYFSNREVPTGP